MLSVFRFSMHVYQVSLLQNIHAEPQFHSEACNLNMSLIAQLTQMLDLGWSLIV